MAWIFDRYTYSKRLQLGHEEYVRPLTMGTNWQSIRIGVRFCVNDSARAPLVQATPNTACALYLGVKQGSTGPSLFSNSVTDWIGGGQIGSALPPLSGNMPFNAGTPNYFSGGAAQTNALWKTGATSTFTAADSVGCFWQGSGQPGSYGSGFMSQAYVNITKGSPNYTITSYYCNSIAQVQTNVTEVAFLTALESQTTPANTTAGNAKSLAYTGAGLFDTLSIASWRSWPHIEIDMIGVCRFT